MVLWFPSFPDNRAARLGPISDNSRVSPRGADIGRNVFAARAGGIVVSRNYSAVSWNSFGRNRYILRFFCSLRGIVVRLCKRYSNTDRSVLTS